MREGPRPVPGRSQDWYDWVGKKEERVDFHTVYRGRTHDGGLDGVRMLGAALEHDLVDVSVEGFAGEIDELGDAFEVVEDLVGGFA